MAKAYFLTEDDHSTLMTMLALFKANKLNIRLRGKSDPDRPGVSPECYIAYPSTADGIPASTDPGTGTTEDDNSAHPGSAECLLYQMITDGTDTPRLESLGDTVLVYNLSSEVIPQKLFPIIRDKFGVWLPSNQGVDAPVIKRGKLLTTLNSGSRAFPDNAVVTVWDFDGSVWTATDDLLTVYDDGMVPDASAPLPIGTWIQIVKIGDYWFYDGHNCDPQSGTGS